jgi:hypothetical protein
MVISLTYLKFRSSGDIILKEKYCGMSWGNWDKIICKSFKHFVYNDTEFVNNIKESKESLYFCNK